MINLSTVRQNYTIPQFLEKIENYDNIKYIIEGGCRDGIDALSLATIFKNAYIYTYEPNPNMINVCKQLTNQCDRIILHNCGLGNIEGSLEFYPYVKSCNQGPSSFLKRTDFNKTQTIVANIPIVKLSQQIQKYNIPYIDLLCLDVQGFELNILNGCDKYIKNIHYIIIEEPVILTKVLIENDNPYIGACTREDLHMFFKMHNFVEIARVYENDYEDNVMYMNTKFLY